MKIVAMLATAMTLSSIGSAQTIRTVNDSIPFTQRFPIGERLDFEGKFGLIKLGRASMRVLPVDTVRGDSTAHYRFEMDASLIGMLRLHNRFDSWTGLHDGRSRRFHQLFRENGNDRYPKYEIFPDSSIYYGPDADTAMTSTSDPLDDTAFFYLVRSLDLQVGQRYELNRYFRPDRNPVIIEVLDRETIDVPAGRFETILIHPIIKGGGVFRESSNARMWITDDEQRLIVQMKTRFSFGTVTLRLTDVTYPEETDAGI